MTKNRYLDLLKWTLTDYIRTDKVEYRPIDKNTFGSYKIILFYLNKILLNKGFTICKSIIQNKENRYNGYDWPQNAETMIGVKRLENIEYCILEILKNNIEGDLIETGVWRGGAVIFMKAVLEVHNIKDKKIWVADSFKGLPIPNLSLYKEDKGDIHYTKHELVVSKETVESNFKKYDLMDDSIMFLEGWFKDTLPNAPIKKLSLLRLDGDMYESTMDSLIHLYPKLSKGGYIIIDDWGAVEGCKKAVLDYREKHQIHEKIEEIDWGGVFWKKENSL